MDNRVIQAILYLVGVPAVLVGYIAGTEWLVRRLPEKQRPEVRPWLWIGPAVLFLFIYLVYPSLNTLVISFFSAKSDTFVGLTNYGYAVTNPDMVLAIRNNLIWLIIFPLITVTFGLVIAVLADRVKYESVAKALIFLPMAISSVAAGVIWKFMYDYRAINQAQTGTLNGVVVGLGGQPQAWLLNEPFNNVALIFVAIWMTTGFCMVILSAGLKGISTEILEASRVDGANEWQVFWRIIFPMMSSTIAVVGTTMVITALKAFDIVYVMTNGAYDTNVIALAMYKQLFSDRNFGRSSAIAVILLLAIVPVMVINIRRFREQEAMR